MARIGCCQIKTHNLLAMLPPGETISPAQISRPNCIGAKSVAAKSLSGQENPSKALNESVWSSTANSSSPSVFVVSSESLAVSEVEWVETSLAIGFVSVVH
jgi:hypothetical protein